MSGGVAPNIQAQAECKLLYVRYNTSVNIVKYLL